MMFFRKIASLFTLLLAMVTGELRAQGEPLTEALTHTPEEATAVIAADNVASFIESPAVRALVAGIEKTEQTVPPTDAWKLLSDRLGLDPEQTIKALASGRTILVLRGENWSIATQVSQETADTLRRNLDTSPRAQSGGLPVLGIEAGNFELILKPERDGALAVIAPAGDRELIADLAQSANHAADHWTQAIELLHDIDAHEADIISAIKLPDRNLLAVTASFDANKVHVRFRPSQAEPGEAFRTPGVLAIPNTVGEQAARAAWTRLEELTRNTNPDILIDFTESKETLQVAFAARLGESAAMDTIDAEMSGVLDAVGHTGEGHSFEGRFPEALRAVTDPSVIPNPVVWGVRDGFLIVAGSETAARSIRSRLGRVLPDPPAADHSRRTVHIDLDAMRAHQAFLFPMLKDILAHASAISWQTITDQDGMISGEATLTTQPIEE